MSIILTSHTVPLNFKNHLCTIGREMTVDNDDREKQKTERNTVWELLFVTS